MVREVFFLDFSLLPVPLTVERFNLIGKVPSYLTQISEAKKTQPAIGTAVCIRFVQVELQAL